ncbi:MAG: DUF1501 domain-containing protein [Chthoniobacter sp.]
MGHPSAGAWGELRPGHGEQGSARIHRTPERRRDAPARRRGRLQQWLSPRPAPGLDPEGRWRGSVAQYQATRERRDPAPAAELHQRHGRQFLREASEPQVEAAIKNYETAYRMQTAVPELCDIRGESEATKKLYGLDNPEANKAAYGRQCLVARRLIERGVRFVELSCLSQNIGAGQAANPWDQHGKLKEGHGAMANQVDQGIAALMTDLKQRGPVRRHPHPLHRRIWPHALFARQRWARPQSHRFQRLDRRRRRARRHRLWRDRRSRLLRCR